MDKDQLKPILEAVLMASSQPLSVDALLKVFPEIEQPEQEALQAALTEMEAGCEGRSYELKKVSSGYRFQVRKEYADFVTRLWEDKPARYSRALLETLALIAYRQPITRGEIEAVRGVSVSSHLIKTLHERDWIKVVGHRDVPGKPSLYATTKEFLDYFNLASLDELPSLQEIRDIDQINAELDLRLPEAGNEEGQTASDELESSTMTAESEADDAAVISLETADDTTAEESASGEPEQPGEGEQADVIEQELMEADADDSAVISLEAADDNAEVVSASEESTAEEDSNPTYGAAPASVEN